MLERFLLEAAVIEAYIGLGSNLGDRLGNLGAAVALLARSPVSSSVAVSLAYESEPVGPPQPPYLNAVAQIGTSLSPRATLQRLQAIEERMGRIRRERGARGRSISISSSSASAWWRRPGCGSRIRSSRTARSRWCRLPRSPPDAVHPGRSLTARELRIASLPGTRDRTRYRAIRPPLPDPEAEEDPAWRP